MRKNRGITLIALVVTIIILLILAGIVISLALGEHGLVQMAEKSKEEYSREEARGKLELVLLHMQAEKEINKEYNSNEYLTSKIEENGMTVNKNTVLVDGWKFRIDRTVPKILTDDEANVSLMTHIKNINSSGNYEVQVQDELYSLHAYVYNGDQTWDNMVFGDENDVGASGKYAQNMVVVKVNGDLTINQEATITAYNTAYGGPKGMFIYCTGTLTNNGIISMTARGAYAEGQNVYIWQNEDESYEYVPAVGAAGGARVSRTSDGTTSGNNGTNGTARMTGGGGSGAASRWSTATSHSGAGAAGTSYSGGTGRRRLFFTNRNQFSRSRSS